MFCNYSITILDYNIFTIKVHLKTQNIKTENKETK